jgi:SAM-dependent methyltransferase/GNAT superfamily N-acetyltransferase
MNAHLPIEIDAHDRTLLEKIGRLRVLAWSTVMPDAASKTDCWLDEFELVVRHWCIFHDGEPVAAARLSVHQRIEDVPDAEVYAGVFPEPPPPPIASLNRLVVHPEFRGKGFAEVLDEMRIQAAEGTGCCCRVVATPAGPKRLAQLSNAGFEPVGRPVPEPPQHFLSGLVTQLLICRLPRGSNADVAGIRTTANNMGWSSDVLNQISREFVRNVAQCKFPVLDIGAAYGVATIPALEAGATVVANDISSEHLDELRGRTPPRLLERLTTLPGKFPGELVFPPESFDAVHASQVLHFLTPDEVAAGLEAAFRWLRPGGRLFVLAATPYQATHAGFAPEFQKRKAGGERWPGLIDNVRAYNTHWSADLTTPWLHVFDDDVLSTAVRAAGFDVEQARLLSRAGLPDFVRLDGREHVGLIARKPGADS